MNNSVAVQVLASSTDLIDIALNLKLVESLSSPQQFIERLV
jgi:hypothetical protein